MLQELIKWREKKVYLVKILFMGWGGSGGISIHELSVSKIMVTALNRLLLEELQSEDEMLIIS